MSIRIIKYSEFIKRQCFETYHPKRRFGFRKERVFPLITKTGTRFVLIGGFVSFFGGVILLFLKMFFMVKENLTRILPGRVVEIRIKK